MAQIGVSRKAVGGIAGMWLILPILTLAFALRSTGLADLRLVGDASWSVHIALKDLPDLTYTTATDSHPPLYYYLLHFWTVAVGSTELALRLLSALFGTLTVTVTYKLGERLGGRSGGLLAASLAGISPFLIAFDRAPRMYSLLALLAALSLCLLLMLLEKPSRTRGGFYLATVLLALYTHYSAVLLVITGFLVFAWHRRGSTRAILAWLGGHIAILLLLLPWLLYALSPSIGATAQDYGTMALPRPSHLGLFLERFWIAFNSGNRIDLDQARLLILGPSLLWIAGLILLLAQQPRMRPLASAVPILATAAAVAGPLTGTALIFLLTPYTPFTRFLLLSTPAYLALLAWLLVKLGRRSRMVGAVGAALAVVPMIYALAGTFSIERSMAEPEAMEVTRQLQAMAGPEDGIIFQAQWQIGYFRTHYGEDAPTPYSLRRLGAQNIQGLLERHPRLWLAMYNARKRDTSYPLERWMDSRAYKAREEWYGRTRLSLYGGKGDPPLETVRANFSNQIDLEAVGVGPKQVKAGSVLRLFLRWRAQRDISQKYIVFVHLVSSDGRGCTGRDGEPMDGLRPTQDWKTGDMIEDRRGIWIGPGVPPGRYFLAVGLYPKGDWRRRLAVRNLNQDRVLLGPVEVLPTDARTAFGTPLKLEIGQGVQLLGYRIGPQPERRPARVVKNVDGPAALWPPFRPQPGTPLRITLYWQAQEALAESYLLRLELVNATGRLAAQAEGPLGGNCPTFRWNPGEVVQDIRILVVKPGTWEDPYYLQATLLSPDGETTLGSLAFGPLIPGDIYTTQGPSLSPGFPP